MKQPEWYAWTEHKLESIDWLLYLAAFVVIAVTLALVINSAKGGQTKTLLALWLTYLYAP